MLFDAVERGLYWITSFMMEGDIESHCQIRAPLDDETLITTSDDLMSVIEIRGSLKLVGAPEFERMAGTLANVLSSLMKSGSGQLGLLHSFAIGFRSAPEGASRLLHEIFEPTFNTAKRLGAVDMSIVEDKLNALVGKCSDESAYLVLYTHRAGLSATARERDERYRTEAIAKQAKSVKDGGVDEVVVQRPKVPATGLIALHNAARRSLAKELGEELDKGGCGLLIRPLAIAPAINMMRRHLDASTFPGKWRPRLLGDRAAAVGSSMVKRKGESTELFPMRIGRQMVPEPYKEVFGDIEMTRRGQFIYGGLVLEVGPESGSLPFSELASRLGRQVPLSMNVELIPNGENCRKADKFYAGFMGAFSDYNKRVKAGWTHLTNLRKSGEYIAGMRVVFSTWARNERDLVDNVSFLRSSIEAWGSSVATNETGSPALLAVAASAGFSRRSPAPYLPGPLSEFARMLPCYRPASVWDDGHFVAHTKEGRPYPIAFGSSKQSYWGTLIFAPSGAGKSFLMNMINAGILLSPGVDDVPYLTVVDVGPSSTLVMDYVRSILPPEKRRQIVNLRIRNDPEFAVCPFDTQHGCDRPTQIDRDFGVSVLGTICPGLGAEGDRFLGQVLDEAYKMFGRKSPEQRKWQNAFDERVNKALSEIRYEVTEDTFVWEVVDALFAAGRIEDSAIAQRYASPRLIDMVKASRTREIMDNWKTAVAANGREDLLSVFTRAIQTAQAEYALVSGFTKFDVGSARAISIDLEEVVGADSEEGRRRSAMMFLFGRRLGAKNYFLRWVELEDLVPDMYREYQQARVKGLEESLKFLEYDEVHFATGIPAMSARLQADLRVGRKYKCVTMMASQMLDDFPKSAVENCYTFFILGAGTKNSVDQLGSTFGLSQSEMSAIESECTGPGRMFAMFKTRAGMTSQILCSTAGSMEKWAFNTDTDDANLRKEVISRTGDDYLAAIKRLAKVYPGGSARDEIAQFLSEKSSEAGAESVIKTLGRKVMSDSNSSSRSSQVVH